VRPRRVLTLGHARLAAALSTFAAPVSDRTLDVHRPVAGPSSARSARARVSAQLRRLSDGSTHWLFETSGARRISPPLAGDNLDAALDRALDAAARNC